MATNYQTPEIANEGASRLVSIGFTPKYKEIDPPTLAVNDTYTLFTVPGGVRITDGFLKAVGGTGLEINGAPTLALKVEIIDDNGTVALVATTTSVRATNDLVGLSNTGKGYLVVSADNDAVIKLTVTTAAATQGTSNVAFELEWSSYADDTVEVPTAV